MNTAPDRIAYVGDFSHPWNTEVHVAYALRQLGHDVLELAEPGLRWRGLPDTLRKAGAGMLLWTHSQPGNHADQLHALAALRDRGTPTVSFHLDRWWGLSRREHQVTDDPFFRTDLVATADGGHADRYQMAGVRHVWLPPGVHAPEVGRGTARPALAADVAFIGGAFDYPHPEWADERAGLVRWAQRRFGAQLRLWPRDRAHPVRGSDLNDVLASTKVVLGDSCLAGGATHYWSDRVPETLGRGGLLVHPHVAGMEDWYEHGTDLFTFDLEDRDALGALIGELLANPALRHQVTERAIELVAGRDTYMHRMRELLQIVAADPVHAGWVDGRAGTVQVRQLGVAQARVSASFDLRPGSTDGTVVREVWQQDHYRMTGTDLTDRWVVDVGAHIGAFTVLAAKLGARVLAVEPVPDNREQLHHHVRLNDVAGQVAVAPCAVCDDVAGGQVRLVFDTSGSRLSAGGELVQGWQLDKLLAEHGLGSEPIAVLKVDCEGCEYVSLAGLAAVLPRVDRAVFEFHGPRMPHMGHLRPGALGALVEVLAEHGTVDVQGRASTGGMLYWRAHR